MRTFFTAAIVTLGLGILGSPGCSPVSDEPSCRSAFVNQTSTLDPTRSSQAFLNTPPANKKCHAKMRIEFRWVKDATARDKAAPKPDVALAFNAGGGTFGFGPGPYSRDDTDGVRWWWSEVDQGDKNNPEPTTFFQTSAVLVGVQDPVLVQMGIYYTPAE